MYKENLVLYSTYVNSSRPLSPNHKADVALRGDEFSTAALYAASVQYCLVL